MTVLLKAFFPPPLHNPPELAPAAPWGVGAAYLCVCVYVRQEVKGSQSTYGVERTGGTGPREGAVLWMGAFLRGTK